MCVSTAGRVAEVSEVEGIVTARVVFDGAREQVCLSYIEGVEAGDFVLVAGGAIVERVSAEEAAERGELARALLDAAAQLNPGGKKS